MSETADRDQEKKGLKLELTSAEMELAPGYVPGQDGNPTVEQLEEALRRELADQLPTSDFPIAITPHKKKP